MDGKMKIIITGHTSPMGNAVYDYYKQKHEVLGVSKVCMACKGLV